MGDALRRVEWNGTGQVRVLSFKPSQRARDDDDDGTEEKKVDRGEGGPIESVLHPPL